MADIMSDDTRIDETPGGAAEAMQKIVDDNRRRKKRAYKGIGRPEIVKPGRSGAAKSNKYDPDKLYPATEPIKYTDKDIPDIVA